MTNPTITHIAPASLGFSGSVLSVNGASIGTASATRRVVVIASLGGGVNASYSSATIGGIFCTSILNRLYSGNWIGIFYADVPTGTTANIVINMNTTIFNGGTAEVFTVDNSTIGAVTVASSIVTSATTIAQNISETQNGAVAGAVFLSFGITTPSSTSFSNVYDDTSTYNCAAGITNGIASTSNKSENLSWGGGANSGQYALFAYAPYVSPPVIQSAWVKA